MEDRGIDRAQWIEEWEGLQDDVRDAPADSLNDLDDLVARMMTSRGLALSERDGEEAPEHEATREFANARAIMRQVDEGEDVDPGDIAYAVDAYRELYESLLDFGPERDVP